MREAAREAAGEAAGERVCSICLDEGGDVFLDCCLKGCVAVFHPPCAARALQASARCPVCRRGVGERTLGSVEAFFSLRSFSSERYSAIESRLDGYERLCAYLLLLCVRASVLRPAGQWWPWRRSPCCRRRSRL